MKARRLEKNGPPAPPFSLDTFANISAEDLSYAAGLIDGEGCLSVSTYKGHRRIAVKVGMTNPEPVAFMAYIFGGNVIPRDPKRGNRKRVYDWARASRPAGAIAKVLLPYLRIPYKIKAAAEMVRIAESIERVVEAQGYKIDVERVA